MGDRHKAAEAVTWLCVILAVNVAVFLWLTARTPQEGEPWAGLGRPRRDPLAPSPSSGDPAPFIFIALYDTERDMGHVPDFVSDMFPEEEAP